MSFVPTQPTKAEVTSAQVMPQQFASIRTHQKRSKARLRQKNRREGGRVAVLPHECMDHPNYIGLSIKARAVLMELIRQFNGYSNNGDLCLAEKLMRPRCLARNTVERARDELEQRGWIVKTRQGSRDNRPNLYALTFHPIHDCKGKLDVSPTTAPLNFWKTGTNPWLATTTCKK